MERLLRLAKKFIPKPVFNFFQPMYHWMLAYAAAVFYGLPSRKLKIIGITGTNGKSTVVAMLSAILEETGESVASLSSLRFRIKNKEWKNTIKMTMPGRFRLQKFLRDAVLAGCKYAVLEVTSEGIKQFRHKGINFFMAVLTNITPEHIESHGSFEKYREAKTKLFYGSKIHILNKDDANLEYFQKIPAQKKVLYSKNDLPKGLNLKLIGEFNKENAASAWVSAKELGVSEEIIKSALEKIENVPGRLGYIQKEPFAVVVDYAHTPDALRKVYETLRRAQGKTQTSKLVCVLGAAGGGRDKWKRPEMGRIAAEHCNKIILTNEDPYDENPNQILLEIESGISNFQFPIFKILDRREAIREALKSASAGDTVIITGKGAEPWIMGPNGSKMPWDDREVAKEELKKL
ncbi:MAG: UDP-N-acetylmuramoyl-L-alanyl-D-glutamate--2,6-diaminopimelate ligase [Patescibacteria group bacterium]|mgnify:CR=1 FL=1